MDSKKMSPFYKYFNTKHGFIDVADTSNAAEGPVGEVSVQVDLKTHPGTGESKITIKGLCKKPTVNLKLNHRSNVQLLLAFSCCCQRFEMA